MTKTPELSVVMSVYNGAAFLRRSIDSILAQEGVDLEFIIVNDGSTDGSNEILGEYAERDRRIRVLEHENLGLTKSLIRGCAGARGEYIARQDVGDISLEGRLLKQLECIRLNPDAALVSCGTRFIGPCGEQLYDLIPNPADATERLLALDLDVIRGPSHHGCALFRRAAYNEAGGYRPAFYYAQDLDLWIRLAEKGPHIIVPELLYEAALTAGAISNIYRKEQIETTGMILECARLRRKGMSERALVEKAATEPQGRRPATTRLDQARFLYFIGSCLNRKGDPLARDYFKQALLQYPLHLKAALRLVLK